MTDVVSTLASTIVDAAARPQLHINVRLAVKAHMYAGMRPSPTDMALALQRASKAIHAGCSTYNCLLLTLRHPERELIPVKQLPQSQELRELQNDKVMYVDATGGYTFG